MDHIEATSLAPRPAVPLIAAPQSNSLDPINLFKYIMWLLLSILKKLVLVSLSWTGSWLGQSFSVTFKMSTLVFIGIAFITVVWALVRYRLMTVYSRLPQDDSDEEQDDEVWFDKKTGRNYSYFDDFLDAIKVFGYIDRKVFDELTRHMRTYRIDEGETIQMNDLDGFAVVIDGEMDVFTRLDQDPNSHHIGHQAAYQLVNKVKKAGPLSSLFTVLDLLTEDVNISDKFYNSEASLPDHIPEMNLNSTELPDEATQGLKSPRSTFKDANESIFAVAKQSTRIAVIPSSTFSLLARKFPAQTANIIQVVLLRWYQVTVNTCGDFFGLTDLVVEPEIELNRTSTSRVPSWIKEGTVKRLKTMAQEDPDKGLYILKPRKPARNTPADRGIHHVSVEVDTSYPGDLVSNVPIISRSNSVFDNEKFFSTINPAFTDSSRGASDDSEDAISRKVLVEEIFKLMGLDGKMNLEETRNNHRGSFVISAPNSPLLALPSILGATNMRSAGTVSSTEEEKVSVTYDELVNHASNLVQVSMYSEGQNISNSGDKCPGLLYVIDGVIAVYSEDRTHLYDVRAGNVAGYLETIASQLSYLNLRAKSDVVVARIPKKSFDLLSDSYPLIYISTGKVLTRILERKMMILNFALEWVHCRAGETLFAENTDADAIYHVVSGRIRGYTNSKENCKPDIKGEYGQGSYLGQLETLVGEQYSSSAIAIRETELAKIPRTLIEFISQIYPHIPFKMTKVVSKEVTRQVKKNNRAATSVSAGNDFATVAVLPIGEVPVNDFSQKLNDAFRKNNRDSILLSRTTVLDYLGPHAFSGMSMLKLKPYLASLEQQHDTLVYVAEDTSVATDWTQTCIDQADCVLLLADANAMPMFSDYEKMLMRTKIHHRCHLILLHNDAVVKPGVTASWLKKRTWVTAHHHIQLDFESKIPMEQHGAHNKKAGLQTLREIKNKIQSELNDRRRKTPSVIKPQHNNYRYKNDFQRLARLLSGEAIGLVLGGGGARGLAHIGIIKALEEKGIPIDMVGGTSIGSFVGGLYASEYDTLSVYRRAKKFAGRFASIWHILLDLTYPATSYTTGHEFNRGIWKAFGNIRIEDFWLRYFNNTTNITHSRMEVHKSGYAWRYIRASMSLAGLVPPIEDKGEMLLDGGYMDNLPVGEMRRLGAKYIIAVDVGSVDDTAPMKYGDSLSGLWVLFNRYNPFSFHPNIPNIAEIQARLAYVSSVKALDDAKNAPSVLYLRPPIDLYATLDFGKFDEIMSVGYTYAIRTLRKLEEDGELDKFPGVKDQKNRWVPDLERRHSF